MTVKNSNIPSQLNAWNQRGPVAKLKSALRTAEDLTLKPGTPVIYNGEQAVIMSRLGDGQLMLRTTAGQHIVASETDVEPVARNFAGNEQAEGR
jgi:hypothetical protein